MAGRKKSVFKGYWGDDSSCLGGDEHVDGQGGGLLQAVMNMQMDKVEDYKVFKEEEQVTREVAKVDKDMVGSRIWGNVG